jgi:thiol-disulfide isomerase/thioredoxin
MHGLAQKAGTLKVGQWCGVLTLNDTTTLPFTFELKLKSGNFSFPTDLIIHNAEERIAVENLRVTPDSISWRMPVFDSYFKCKIVSDSSFSGIWYNNSARKPYQTTFRAFYNKPRFPADIVKESRRGLGRYKAVFSPGTADSSYAVGIFSVNSSEQITGTFLTETGDYRYLEGRFDDHRQRFQVSCFDGSHAFLFQFYMRSDTISGKFYSGIYWYENFYMLPNDTFQLRNAEQLTWIKDSSDIDFTFYDLNGRKVSLSDPQFKNKVVVIQLMGSWCPNCMDETRFLSQLHMQYASRGLEVVALAYERAPDTAQANANLRRMIRQLNVHYTVLNTGKTGKEAAAESLPFLNGVMAFPTTLYRDRAGKIRMIYTGFNGPGTGAAYEKLTEDTRRLILQLLAESIVNEK